MRSGAPLFQAPHTAAVPPGMTKKPRKSAYAVAVGRQPGIYSTWDECHAQVSGHSGAVYKGFGSHAEAEAWLRNTRSTVPAPPPWAFPLHSSGLALPFHPDAYAPLAPPKRKIPVSKPCVELPPKRAFASSCVSPWDTFASSSALPGPATAPEPAGPAVPEPEITLDPEQQQAFECALRGGNLFFTGPAGTGKSVLQEKIVAALRGRGKEVAVVAPTGIAADRIGGTTLHSWAGCGVPKTRCVAHPGPQQPHRLRGRGRAIQPSCLAHEPQESSSNPQSRTARLSWTRGHR